MQVGLGLVDVSPELARARLARPGFGATAPWFGLGERPRLIRLISDAAALRGELAARGGAVVLSPAAREQEPFARHPEAGLPRGGMRLTPEEFAGQARARVRREARGVARDF